MPLFSFAVLVGAALALSTDPAPALYLTGSVVVLLLFTGIHNAWDLVTYLAVERSHPEDNRQD